MSKRLVYGIGPVREVMKAGHSIVVLYVRPAYKKRDAKVHDAVAHIAKDARSCGIFVEQRRREELDELAGNRHHQGVVAVVGDYQYVDIEDLIQTFVGEQDRTRSHGASDTAHEPFLCIALDGVQDPHNLGAIIRSAQVLGARGVIIPRDRAAQVTAVVTKASAGATEHIAIAQVTNLTRALTRLKEAGVWLAAVASSPEARAIDELDATLPLCLVMGAEGTGIRRLVAKTCDIKVQIPMAQSAIGSLNVSVAAGIALYELARQRRSVPV